MISKKTLQFLKDLRKNNNRDWFSLNKSRYEEARAEFEKFIYELIQEIERFDKSVSHLTAKDCVFRIYRDVRFSNDKSPYKTHLGAHISSAQAKSEIHTRAGYYVHISDEDSMLAGGAYKPSSEWLNAIRNEIYNNAKDLKKVINGTDFKKYFGTIEGEKLSRPPRGYDPNHPEIEFLKYKSFLAVHNLSESQILSKDFLSHSVKVFKTLYPFDKFLNQDRDK